MKAPESEDKALLRRDSAGLALVLLTAIGTIGFADRILLNVMVEPIRKEFGLNDTEIGLLAGLAYALLNVILGIVVARIAERRRRLSLIALGTFLWSLATAFTGLAASFMQLFAARIAVGVGEAIGLPASQSTLSDFFKPSRRTTAMSVLLLAPPIGAFLGAAGGSLVAQEWGWRYAFYAAAVPGFALSLLTWLLLAEPPRGRYDKGDVESVPALREVVMRFARMPSLRHFVAGSTLASAGGFAFNSFFAALMARRYGFSLLEAGLANGFIAAVPATMSVFFGGMVADRLAPRLPHSYARVPALTLLITPVLLVAGLSMHTAWAALALLSIAVLFQFAYLGCTHGTIQNLMYPRMRATATALANVAFSVIGGGLGPLIVGNLSDRLRAAGMSPGDALATAMGSITLFYLWSALHYRLAEKTIDADLRETAKGIALTA